jgi:hypothetical protein
MGSWCSDRLGVPVELIGAIEPVGDLAPSAGTLIRWTLRHPAT